jgi:hypothetical protein
MRAQERDPRITVVYGVMACLAIVVVLQWVLFSAAIQAFQGGETRLLGFATLLSAGCFAAGRVLIRGLKR